MVTDPDPLVAWLEDVHRRAMATAVAACGRDGDAQVAPELEHWQWETCHGDRYVDPTAAEDAYLEEKVSLRSIEQYPTRSVGPLPTFAIGSTEEVQAAAAALILMGDPASVRARVDAERARLATHEALRFGGHIRADSGAQVKVTARCCSTCSPARGLWPCPEWRWTAAGWCTWPGYDPAWRPEVSAR